MHFSYSLMCSIWFEYTVLVSVTHVIVISYKT